MFTICYITPTCDSFVAFLTVSCIYQVLVIPPERNIKLICVDTVVTSVLNIITQKEVYDLFSDFI